MGTESLSVLRQKSKSPAVMNICTCRPHLSRCVLFLLISNPPPTSTAFMNQSHPRNMAINFFSDNQPDALIIYIYSVIKLYMFRTLSLCPSSGVLYCTFFFLLALQPPLGVAVYSPLAEFSLLAYEVS